MGIDASAVFNVGEGIKKINRGITNSTYNYYKTIDRITALLTDGTMHVVNTSATTCEECWEEMKRRGYLSIDVSSNQDQVEHIVHASLVREMFLGRKRLR